ncbi:YdcF family protein [Dyella lipolytica]|uniref:YdcF family protein n=1 Tax=Dyella lipolytica TaxID=1867835 RepID=UPI0024E171D4|nr:YdcF family protein [Dyella lipolytica]
MMLLLILVLLGYAWGRFRWHRCQRMFYGLALLLFFAAGCGPLPAWLLARLQAPYAAQPNVSWTSRNAIVLLGAGTTRVTATNQVEPTIFADGRILEAYALYRSCRQAERDCKLVVSGGDAFRNGVPEAVAYATVLQAIGVDRSDLLLESRSMNTWQNAQFVKPMLDTYAPQRVVLVSSALHLHRAQLYFAHFGIDAIPVRGDYADVRLSWLPNAWNVRLTDVALHEYVGVLTYHLYNAMGWNTPPSRYGAA